MLMFNIFLAISYKTRQNNACNVFPAWLEVQWLILN